MPDSIRPRLALAALGSLAALAACGEEPSVAEKFNSLSAEVENKGREYEAEAENLVAADERARLREADEAIRQTANQLGASNVAADTGGNAPD